MMDKFLLFSLLSVFSFFSPNGHTQEGATHPPFPPAENQNPPVTPQDKARVAFADLVIKNLLMSPIEKPVPLKERVPMHNQMMDLSEKCVQSSTCLSKNESAKISIDSLKSEYGVIHEFKHTHVIPWSFKKFGENIKNMGQTENFKPTDGTILPVLRSHEYMLHSYVNFHHVPGSSRSDWVSGWYHLDIIVTEDKNGNLKLRRFFLIGLENPNTNTMGTTCFRFSDFLPQS